MDKLKFKVGDEVRVIAEKHGHVFNIGEKVTIERLFHNGAFVPEYWATNSIKAWYIGEDEIEAIEETPNEPK